MCLQSASKAALTALESLRTEGHLSPVHGQLGQPWETPHPKNTKGNRSTNSSHCAFPNAYKQRTRLSPPARDRCSQKRCQNPQRVLFQSPGWFGRRRWGIPLSAGSAVFLPLSAPLEALFLQERLLGKENGQLISVLEKSHPWKSLLIKKDNVRERKALLIRIKTVLTTEVLWDISIVLWRSQDCPKKLYLESGWSQWLADGIGHREASNVDRVDNQEGKGGD